MKRNVFPTYSDQTSTTSINTTINNHHHQYSRAAVVKKQEECGSGGGGIYNNRVRPPPPNSASRLSSSVNYNEGNASTAADCSQLLNQPQGGDQHQHYPYVENVDLDYCRHNSVTSDTIDRYCSIVAGPSTIATSVVVGSVAVGGLSADGYPIISRNNQTDVAEPLGVDTNASGGGYAVTNSTDDYHFPNRSTVGGGGCAFTTLNHSNHSAASSNNKDWLSKQQQQFAFFPNATEKVMANTRRIIVLSIYSSSVVLSVILFFLAGVYCQVTGCSITWAEKNRQYAQFFPIASSCLIAFFSTCWLISNFRRVETTCMRDYNFLEMPTAVFSALLAGVCAVIEIHYNFDYSYLYWSEKWALAAADSVILVFLHAGLAFALT